MSNILRIRSLKVVLFDEPHNEEIGLVAYLDGLLVKNYRFYTENIALNPFEALGYIMSLLSCSFSNSFIRDFTIYKLKDGFDISEAIGEYEDENEEICYENMFFAQIQHMVEKLDVEIYEED